MIDNVTQWTRLLATNTTQNSVASKIPLASAPTPGAVTGGAVLNLSQQGQVRSILQLMIFGAGSDNNTTECLVYGWNVDGGGTWIPCLLADFTATLSSTQAGLATGSTTTLNTTDYLADTLSLASGFNNNTSIEFTSPGGDAANLSAAVAQIDLKAFSLVEIQFNRGSSATNSNAMWRLLG
jgi:hypothetical protein